METNSQRLKRFTYTLSQIGLEFSHHIDILPDTLTLYCDKKGMYLTDIRDIVAVRSFLNMSVTAKTASAPVLLIPPRDSTSFAFSFVLPKKGIYEKLDTGYRIESGDCQLTITGSAEWMAQSGLTDLWREKKDENEVARFVLQNQGVVIIDGDTLSLGVKYCYRAEEETDCAAADSEFCDNLNDMLEQWLAAHRTDKATEEQLMHLKDILSSNKKNTTSLCVALFCAIEEKGVLKNYRQSDVSVEDYFDSLLQILGITCGATNMRKTYSKVKQDLEDDKSDKKNRNHKSYEKFLAQIG